MEQPIKKPRNRAAGIVVKDGKILLMHRINNGAEYYVFPGGGIEKDEKPKETTVREIQEETSIDVKVIRLLYELTREGGEHEYYYECEYVSGEPMLHEDTNEFRHMQLGSQLYHPMWIALKDMPDLTIYPIEIKKKVIADTLHGNQNKN
jgi:8-oxo-dGTP pyrophosphatase MutT (NUDIX family)